MSKPSSIVHDLRWDVALIAVILGLLGLAKLLTEPHVQRVDSEAAVGSRPPDRTEGDILLLLPDTPAAPAKSFDELDCSYGWYNGLWQEFGTFATALTRDLSPEILAGRSVVIVPRRVAEAMPQTGISALAGFVRGGGQLILERPPEGWERLSGLAAATGKLRQAQRITSSEGLNVHGPLRKHLPNVPLSGKLLPAPRMDAWPDGPMLLEVDGQPGVTLRAMGQGHVYTVLFDFGCTVTALQQGKPTHGMGFELRQTDTGPLLPASRRIAHDRLKNSRVPYADLLERALFHRLSEVRPLPSLWLYPGTSAGALLITHPTPENMRAALGFADWSRKQQGSSTVFAAADRLNASQLALLDETSADVALLWVRGVDREPMTRTLGMGALRPFARELSLKDQRDMLMRKLGPDRPVHISHVEGARWTNDWSTTFRQLAEARLRLDMSFGPVEPEEHGYLFGTGFPFYPVDERGLPLPILELPYVLHEGSLNEKRLRNMLSNSRAYFHQPLAISLPSHAMRTRPSAGILLALSKAHEHATQKKHWITTAHELLAFLSARRKSVITSQWSAATRRLTISVNILGARSRTITGGAFPGVAIPRTWRGEEIERIILDGKELSLRKLATNGSSTLRIMEVGPGRHTISVYYATPTAAAPTAPKP